MNVRRYELADLEPTIKLWHNALHRMLEGTRLKFSAEWLVISFEEMLARQQEVWLAVRGEQVVGFMVRKGSLVSNLFVAPGSQRQGVGRMLLQRAKELSPAELTVCTLSRNLQARQFYEKNGFRFSRARPSAVRGELEVVYRWTSQKERYESSA